MQHLSLTRHHETTDRPPDRPITDGRCVMLQRGRTVINEEADALRNLACHLDASFGNLAEAVLATRGMVVVSGLGKSWLVGARLSATLAATGTHSIMLHPTDALHGDLGRLREGDLLLVISNSGETPEVLALIGAARTAVPGLAIAALTGNGTSSIARAANLAVSVGKLHEACSLGLAPTTSAIVFAALGDALVVATAAARGFNMRDFARIHPGGTLGQRVQAPERVVGHATNGDWTPLQGSLSSAGHSREISQGEHSGGTRCMNVGHCLALRRLFKHASAFSGSWVVAWLSRPTREPAADFDWQRDKYPAYVTNSTFHVKNRPA